MPIKDKLTRFIENIFLSSHFMHAVLIKSMLFKKWLLSFIDKKNDRKKLMIDIGGGRSCRRHWKVLDIPSQHYNYPSWSIDYIYDLTSNKPFPLQDESVSFFYSGNTLEHIPQEYCYNIFNEIYRCLKIGGVIRFSLPDFDLAYEALRKNNIDFLKAYPGSTIEQKFINFFVTHSEFKISLAELQERFKLMKKDELAEYCIKELGIDHKDSSCCAEKHINWWNYDKLNNMLKEAGFKKINRSNEQRSCFKELRGRGIYWGFDSTCPEISFWAEAIK